MDSVNRRIGSGDSQGTGRLQYGRRRKRDGTTAEELRGAGLRGAGLKVTAARVALLETVRVGDDFGVEVIASGSLPGCAIAWAMSPLQAGREAVRALTTAGLVRRIEPAGDPARLERRVVPSLTSTARSARPLCLTASADHGFSIDEAEVRGRPLRLVPRLSHRPEFLSTMIRPVRKDSHV
ncbi:hypothetical protein Save01_03074 [Streptomyces avermitilis]|uniref:Uncharacterized protein n=1 Tax=Streptomyces avermitilis TaxID=33903 RepID=A0A4D4MHA7_STRAX|nr:hypothetical protein SAV14893_075950 [Streptomyces avermitilis]GDY71441.1 hypothetical protein SAV31267_009260 [Streptomyces avermitilis]